MNWKKGQFWYKTMRTLSLHQTNLGGDKITWLIRFSQTERCEFSTNQNADFEEK